ncbi:hypothetical protein [Chitinasiproducens palmae]|uniref:Uncharacterized protein n=1 Tax=Chitinasiproducens palmae TaxID=1770053 RepID=A0A1H2PPR0_9BURK|nr:hypothetical protein [Chitinasiproducens palmae]SDV48756.1 hypothetical protein SAMN05216551_10639 [Chitinasiproducens palmae]
MEKSKQDSFAGEDLDALKRRADIVGNFGWSVVSGVTAIVLREKGETALNNVWRALMTAEQSHRFVEALEKLGIRNDPPAVTAAKYHYFSNTIGGLRLQYMAESPKKVWIRYLPPWGTFPGISALAVPSSVRRTILSTWHPRNGELLGCPRLGWVATKFVAEGHQYDEGYFMEYDHDLRPEERFRVEHVAHTPEFDPATAPQLDPQVWPEARIVKGGANYASDYVTHVIEAIVAQFGIHAASQMVSSAMKLLAVQFTPALKAQTGTTGNSVAAIAETFATIVGAFKNTVHVKALDNDRVELVFDSFKPFPFLDAPAMRNAVFDFFEMSVRTLNGHVRIERRNQPDGTEHWTLTDTHAWLW